MVLTVCPPPPLPRQECGLKLTEVTPRGVHGVFETLRSILHSGKITSRVQYMIEVMFAIRKDKFKVRIIIHVLRRKERSCDSHVTAVLLLRTIPSFPMVWTWWTRTIKSLTCCLLTMTLTLKMASVRLPLAAYPRLFLEICGYKANLSCVTHTHIITSSLSPSLPPSLPPSLSRRVLPGPRLPV